MKMKSLMVILLAMAAGEVSLTADVTLPSVISDHMVLQRNKPIKIWGWASDGEKISVRLAGVERVTYPWNNRWEVTFPPMSAKQEPIELVVDGFNRITVKDILIGEVWLAGGQSNMHMTVESTSHSEASQEQANEPQLRLFYTEKKSADTPQPDVEGKWVLSSAETIKDFSAVAFHFGLEILKKEHVPVGMIESSVGGTRAVNWTSAAVLAQNPDSISHYDQYRQLLREYPQKLDQWREKLADGKQVSKPTSPFRRQPAGYFNGMINGLAGYTIRGAIWYQGETDTWNAEQYTRMFPDMITDWRNHWNQGDFPFLYVQLPGFNGKDGADENYPFLREIQRRVESTLPNLAMAVTIDQGEELNIHPKEKREVAHRLTLLARKEVYGENIIASGPRPKDVSFTSDGARVKFSHTAEGLEVKGDTLRGFYLSGEDGVFYPAQAEIEGDSVLVTSEKVATPVHLRYGFSGFPDCNLYNSANLPAVPFRTDDYPRSDSALTTVPE